MTTKQTAQEMAEKLTESIVDKCSIDNSLLELVIKDLILSELNLESLLEDKVMLQWAIEHPRLFHVACLESHLPTRTVITNAMKEQEKAKC